MDFITDLFTLTNILWLIAAIIGLIAAYTGLNFISEIKDIAETYRKAKLPESDGGKKVTDEELRQIEKEISDAVLAIWNHYKGHIIGWLGRVFSKIAFWK